MRNLQDEGLSLAEFARVIQADSDLQGYIDPSNLNDSLSFVR